MLFKSLFLLVFANLFNQAYQLQQIKCPKWVPGTNQILPQGVTLSPELELKNRVRCYCKVVKEKERQCIAQHVPASRLNGLRIILNSRKASNSSMEYLLFLDETG